MNRQSDARSCLDSGKLRKLCRKVGAEQMDHSNHSREWVMVKPETLICLVDGGIGHPEEGSRLVRICPKTGLSGHVNLGLLNDPVRHRVIE